MAHDWHTLPFSEAVDVNPRVTLSRGDVYPFVEMAAVEPSSRSVAPSEQRAYKGGGARFRAGDTLMARITPCLENGKIARFGANDGVVGFGSTEFIVIRGREGVTDNGYAYYLTKWETVRNFAISQMTGSSGRQRVPVDSLANIDIPIPPLSEQKAIAHILGTLDDKIELNRQMNRTLEDIARALFKSWFVDFDPVHAKERGEPPAGMDAATAALFPAEFEESELGPIPKGWRVGTLGDIAELTIGGDWGKADSFDDAIEVVCLRGVDLEHLRSNGEADAPRRWIKQSSLTKRKMDDRDVLIAASGVGPVGRPLWIAPSLHHIYREPVLYSNFCKRFRSESPQVAVYVDRVLLDVRESGRIWEYASGTSIPNLDHKGLLSALAIVIPDDSILQAFYDFYRPTAEMLYSTESRTLAELRDTLLPKLMSGELRVPEAGAQLRKAV